MPSSIHVIELRKKCGTIKVSFNKDTNTNKTYSEHRVQKYKTTRKWDSLAELNWPSPGLHSCFIWRLCVCVNLYIDLIKMIRNKCKNWALRERSSLNRHPGKLTGIWDFVIDYLKDQRRGETLTLNYKQSKLSGMPFDRIASRKDGYSKKKVDIDGIRTETTKIMVLWTTEGLQKNRLENGSGR